MLKIKKKGDTRDENRSAQHGFKKKNCKIRISSENGKPHPFRPAQFLLQRCFNLGCKSTQGAVPGFSPKPPCQKPGGLRYKPKEDGTMNN